MTHTTLKPATSEQLDDILDFAYGTRARRKATRARNEAIAWFAAQRKKKAKAAAEIEQSAVPPKGEDHAQHLKHVARQAADVHWPAANVAMLDAIPNRSEHVGQRSAERNLGVTIVQMSLFISVLGSLFTILVTQ